MSDTTSETLGVWMADPDGEEIVELPITIKRTAIFRGFVTSAFERLVRDP